MRNGGLARNRNRRPYFRLNGERHGSNIKASLSWRPARGSNETNGVSVSPAREILTQRGKGTACMPATANHVLYNGSRGGACNGIERGLWLKRNESGAVSRRIVLARYMALGRYNNA
jgi:hypothetical protein